MRQQRRARLAGFAARTAAAPPGGSDAVTGITVHPLREPASGRRYTVIRLETAGGLSGYGECGGVAPEAIALARQTLPGAAATAVEPVRRLLAEHPRLQAAVNMALLDIAAKAAQVPLCQFLGGPTRNRVRAMAPLAGGSDGALGESMRAVKAAGHRAFAVALPPPPARNQGQGYVRAVLRRLESLRAAAGEECDFVLAGAGKLTPGDAAALSRALERFHLLWFDEPCEAVGLETAARLSAESVTPLGFGAAIESPAGFLDLLREGIADVLRPAVGVHGITQIRKIAALAETYYVAVAPVHTGGPVATAAALHLAASLPNFFIQETPFPAAEADRRMREAIAGPALEKPVEGYFHLPAGPGLGINVDEGALATHRERAV